MCNYFISKINLVYRALSLFYNLILYFLEFKNSFSILSIHFHKLNELISIGNN